MRLIFDTYKKYWYCVKPNRTYIFIIVISKILAVIASILIPFTAAGIVKYLTIANYKEALKWIFYFFAAVTSRVLFYYWNYYGAGLDSNYCYVKLKEKVFDKLSTYDLEFSKRKNIDEILQATSGDIWKVVNINDNLSDILIGAVRIVVIVILTTLTSPFVGGVVLLFSGLYVLFMMFFNNKIAKYLNKQRKYQDKIAGIFLEELSSLEEMKIYDMQDKYYHYFNTVNKKFCHNYRLKRRYEDVQVNFLQLILDLGKVCIYAVTLYLLFWNAYSVDQIVLVIGYFTMLNQELKYVLQDCVKNVVNCRVSVLRIYDLLTYQPKNMQITENTCEDHIKGQLEFRHVSTSYSGKPILKDVSFQVNPHELTAVVGRSGSGKSTIFNIILRLIKPDSGNVFIDQEDIYHYSFDVYKTNVSVVTQKSILFSMSIRDNLSLVDSNIERQQEVCKRLGIHDEILSLPQGYQTIILDNGSNISTSLKQLLSVARSILTKAEILLFDEVTSSLDTTNTKKVMKVFRELARDHTVIIITHKKEVMNLADHLIIIDHGKKVADGTPLELANNTYYLNLKDSSSADLL
mgnify:FL=1